MKRLSFMKIASVALVAVAGLVPAFLLMSGSEWPLESVRAEVLSESLLHTPQDPFEIRFSRAVDPESYRDNISISPAIPLLYSWSEDGRTLSLKPEVKWSEGSQYQVFLGPGKSGFGRTVPMAAFSFHTPTYPEIVSITPKDGSTDLLLDIEDPITVRFDRSVADFYVDFRLSPSMPVTFRNDAGKTEFKVLPKESVKPGTEYRLEVFAKWRGESDGAYRSLGSTTFTTLPERPKEWSRDLEERLAEARRFARPIMATGKYIDINIDAQVMTIFENGTLLDTYLVSSGLRGMDTPKGQYKIENKARRPWSKKYELYMPNWMAITSDGKYGIHELPEWPSGYKEGANHLGVPVSHGCVRLGVGPAARVWSWAEIGTPVVIH